MTGAVLAAVWARSDHQAVAKEVLAAFEFGDERTVVQHVASPVRQLADIALRALSPALNDPTTAENAMDSLADTLVVFARRERPPISRCDQDGTPRFIAIAPTLDDLVRLGFDQAGRASRPYPVMAKRLLTLLEHLQATATDPRRGPARGPRSARPRGRSLVNSAVEAQPRLLEVDVALDAP